MHETAEHSPGFPTGSVLVVDDDLQTRATLERALTRVGYAVRTCAGVDEALEALGRTDFDVLITDLRMPTRSGLDLLAEVRRHAPSMPTILISGGAETTDAAAAIEHGVSRLLLKPFSINELRAAVAGEFERIRTRTRSRVEDEATRAREREAVSRTWIVRAARALTAAVEAKDPYTAGHAKRVSSYAGALATALGSHEVERIQFASDLHDVGKIGVPDMILNKAGRLDDSEMAQIRLHPEAGERILRPLIDDPLVLSVARSHHERWDGSGYPDGLAGTAIPAAARIVAVADVLDATTSHRAYRTGMRWDDAVREIRQWSGSQFDPDVVSAMVDQLSLLRQLYDEDLRERP